MNPYASNMFSGKTSSLELGQNVKDMTSFLDQGEAQSSKHDAKRASILKFINRFQVNESEELKRDTLVRAQSLAERASRVQTK